MPVADSRPRASTLTTDFAAFSTASARLSEYFCASLIIVSSVTNNDHSVWLQNIITGLALPSPTRRRGARQMVRRGRKPDSIKILNRKGREGREERQEGFWGCCFLSVLGGLGGEGFNLLLATLYRDQRPPDGQRHGLGPRGGAQLGHGRA